MLVWALWNQVINKSLTIVKVFFVFLGKCSEMVRKVILCMFIIPYIMAKFTIVIRNGKIVWKHGPYRWYFQLNLKYLGWLYRAYIKTAKNGDFSEELLSENDFETVLATFCCYDHGAKASEAVQKIATDQKEYRKCSLCVIICWIAKI